MGAPVTATAGPRSADLVGRNGASTVVNYHSPDWQAQVRAASSADLPAVVNAVRGEAGRVMSPVATGGRLATITSDPPAAARGINVTDCYVRPGGAKLEKLAARFVERGFSIP